MGQALTLSVDDERLLGAAPMFAELGDAAIRLLLEQARLVDRKNGGMLFTQGEPADRFYFVLAGSVDLFTLTASGEQSLIEFVEAGETFAEAAMFADAKFPLSAAARLGTRLIEFPAKPFLRALGEDKSLVFKLLVGLARRQRRMWNEIADLKSRSPVQRLGLFLLAQADALGVGDGEPFALPWTKAELASRIGIAPESLSRALSRLRPAGLSTVKRDFVIADKASLRAFCGAV